MDYKYTVKGKPSYYSIDTEDKNYIEKCLKDYKNRKFNRMTMLLADEHFIELLKLYYLEKQIGIKSLIKLLDNIVSYTTMRSIVKLAGILVTGVNHIFSDEQKNMRQYNAKNKITPCYGGKDVYHSSHSYYTSNKQGIQGYYYSKMNKKNIWIRSTYEYIVVEYLEKNNIKYIYETKEYTLSDGRKYRPDFHILKEDDSVDYILEIKSGYYLSHQDDKGFILGKEIETKVFVIFEVNGICEFFKIDEQNCNKFYSLKLKEWKNIRRSKNEICESEEDI